MGETRFTQGVTVKTNQKKTALEERLSYKCTYTGTYKENIHIIDTYIHPLLLIYIPLKRTRAYRQIIPLSHSPLPHPTAILLILPPSSSSLMQESAFLSRAVSFLKVEANTAPTPLALYKIPEPTLNLPLCCLNCFKINPLLQGRVGVA